MALEILMMKPQVRGRSPSWVVSMGLGFRVLSDFAGSGFEREKKFRFRGNEVKRFGLLAAPYGAATCRRFLGRSSRGPFLLFPPTRRS